MTTFTPARIRRSAVRALPWLAALTTSCGGDTDYSALDQPRAWTQESGARWRPLAVGASNRAGFSAVPPGWSGVTSANSLSEASLLENQMRMNGSGVALGDVDGDELVDMFLSRLDGSNVLYRNLGDWRFEDVTGTAGVAAEGRFSTGAVLVDVDGDADLDLVLNTLGGGKSLYRNDGSGRFSPVADAGLAGDTGAMSATLADIDGDSDLDLYITNYKRQSVLDLFSPEERAFPNTVRRTATGFELTELFEPHFELVWRGNGVQRLEKAESDELYLNDGTGRFSLVPFDSGAFLDSDGAPLDGGLPEWGLAARFGDLDGDGDPDLYVANDLHSPDRLWINQGDGSFRMVSPWAVRTTSASTMAVDFSDVDRDGDLDIFTIDMLSRSPRRRKTQDPVARMERVLPGDLAGTQQVPRNALLINRGDNSYAEIANYAGLEASDWSWSALFVDVDLDGYEDLLIPNGHIRDLMDADTQIRLRGTRLADWRQTILLYEPLPLPNVAFRNLGNLRFEETGKAWGLAEEPDISHGAALGDLDGDGDLDVVINRLDQPPLVLRNETSAARLAVRLQGRGGNTAGVGARISIDAEGLPRQTKEISAGGGYLSGSEALATFAMGAAGSASIEVEWRSGLRSRVAVGGPDRLYEITEPEGPEGDDGTAEANEAAVANGEAGAAEARFGSDDGSGPWFVLDPAFAPIHDEPVFDEVSRQPLLPLRLSQMGPQFAWEDLDGDGDPELLMGGGSGTAPALFRNDAGTLVRVTMSGPNVPVDQTSVIPLPAPSGGRRILLGLSSYEAPDAEMESVPAVVSVEWQMSGSTRSVVAPRVRPVVSGAASSAGALAVADYDGDGWLDLFVAGRVRPGRYPEPADSRLFRGRPGGDFEPDVAGSAALRGVGLVTGALFSDIDVDGDPDLVLAIEWGPVRVLRNDGGRFEDVTDEVGLGGWVSRWNAIAAGDFDSDGRPDLIATSWGENTENRATIDAPLEVYYEDVDRNGTLDIIEARFDPRLRAVAPLARYTRLGAAVPGVLERVSSHAEYADASLEDLLRGRPAGHASVTGFSHRIFLNRGDRFETKVLPMEAQWSPSLGVVVADADGDGAEDVFLAQNFFATDEDSPRYDSGRGLWLRGDGQGGFEAVPAATSGIEVYGDQRGVAVADVDGDGRPDMVIGQNGAPARLYRNRGGKPGLRVRLLGSPTNPDGIGATLRVVYGSRKGPAREIRAGSGTGSYDDPVQVLGLASEPTGVEVRWPGGRVEVVPLAPDQREVTVGAVERAGSR